MGALDKKNILLCVTGSIAAYKSAVLARTLIKEGCVVRVVMTESATKFVSTLTFSTLTNHGVSISIIENDSWSNHVELGLWADLVLVAPCTATTLGKMANGIADSMVVACYLSAKCPVMIAPAMDLDMWKHPSTVINIELLKSFGNEIIPVGNGYLASGLYGDGRMAEPEEIVSYVENYFAKSLDLLNKNVLITAGPTYEAIDPVRFIGNRSTGKQGIALAVECANRGANVTLILGPTQLTIIDENIIVINIQSAHEMYKASLAHFAKSELIILAAAVADYKSQDVATQKLKKQQDDLSILLERTIDIAATLGAQKSPDQVMVGFALETNDEILHAKEKLHKKNLDFIVLNSLQDAGAGFGYDTNKVTILAKDGKMTAFDLKTKEQVAKDIVDYYVRL
jgi:phosphopantothenoylcysteine decarboxylase / phosphopantothenate---cysteine ligase